MNKLRTNRRRRHRRPTVGLDPADGFLDSLADPNGELAREWDLEHDRHVFQKLLAIVQPDFSSTSWEAFRRFAVDGLPAAQVAEEMKLTVNAVLQAKSRILNRLREEAGERLASIEIWRHVRSGTVVLSHIEQDKSVNVEWPDGKRKGRARITISPGKHSVQVKVHGVQVSHQELIVESGGLTRFVVDIDPPAPSPERNNRFRPGPSDPERFTVNRGQWIVQGDELTQTESRAYWPCVMFGDARWIDYDFNVDLMRLCVTGPAYLVVRAEDENNNAFFGTSTWGGASSRLSANENRVIRVLGEVGRRFESLKWYAVRVRVHGSKDPDGWFVARGDAAMPFSPGCRMSQPRPSRAGNRASGGLRKRP